jgi:hypothetical protein
MAKSALRLEYDRIRYGNSGQVIGDRQWDRICDILAIVDDEAGDAILSHWDDVQNYARLRKMCPRATIGLAQVRQLAALLRLLGNHEADTDELMRAIQMVFQRVPHEQTIRRWMQNAGLKYGRRKKYSPQEMQIMVPILVGRRTHYQEQFA